MKHRISPAGTMVAAGLVFLSACTAETPPQNPKASAAQDSDSETPPSTDHGDAVDLGTVTLASKEFGMVRLGDIVAGKEGAIEVHPKDLAESEWSQWNFFLWVEDKVGTQLSAPSKGEREGRGLHFHVTPRDTGREPVRAVLRLRYDGVDERDSLPLDGHGHEHEHGPHDGNTAKFSDGKGTTGHLELKLHDDKGDLELWLAKDDHITEPFDVPLGTTVQIFFIDVGGREISLRPRNTEENEDESGNANVRGGKTNYFVYPTSGDDDASWLRGKDFNSIVTVAFSAGGVDYRSEEFVVAPHAH